MDDDRISPLTGDRCGNIDWLKYPYLRNGALLMDKAKLKWNILFANAGTETSYDAWLERYLPLLREAKGPALDLGCGLGNATSFLLNHDIETISCDFSCRALDYVRNKFPKTTTILHDMRNKFPFEDGKFGIVVADLSIHYFTWEKTREIMGEINRILRAEGVFLFRVNSVNDLNYGAGEGREIERHYYSIEGDKKRFFDADDIAMLIADEWTVIRKAEDRMDRYGKEKHVWEVVLRK